MHPPVFIRFYTCAHTYILAVISNLILKFIKTKNGSLQTKLSYSKTHLDKIILIFKLAFLYLQTLFFFFWNDREFAICKAFQTI